MLLLRFQQRASNGALLPICMDSLGGKVIIITGASEGIGASLATALQTRGALLSLTARNAFRLREIAAPDSLITAGDITDPAVRAAVISGAMERWGRIDVLINNAGRGSYYPASSSPLNDARALFDLNFFAPLALAQLATPALRQTRGAIVNISSIAGQIPLPWMPVYSASKAALASLTATQRSELARDGVNVMGVFPGYVSTDFQSHAEGSRPPDRIAQGKKRFAVSAAVCAEAIVAGIEQRRRVVVTPKSGWPLVFLHRLFPALIESRLSAV